MHPRRLLLPLLLAAPALHAADRSLPEAIAFRRLYLRENPAESAIVLTEEASAGRLQGACFYTDHDTLYVHRDGHASRLPGLAAVDLDTPDRLRAGEARLAAPTVAPSAPPSAATLAADLRGGGMIVVSAPDDSLVFDWEGRHLIYSEGGGCRFQRIDPRALAPRGDLIDAIVFAQNYRSEHPEEEAVLVTQPAPRLGERLIAGAAFTRAGRLRLHCPGRGDVEAAGHAAGDIQSPALLYRLLRAALASHAWPAAAQAAALLPSDTALLQLARLRESLKSVDIQAAINDQVLDRQGRVDPALTRLVFDWAGRQYGYTPQTGGYAKGPAPQATRTSFLDGIFFAQAYRAAHPDETVAVMAHPLSDRSDPRRVVADTVYTRHGTVRLHSLLAGDWPVEGLTPGQLGSAETVERAVQPLFARRFSEARAHPHPDPDKGDAPHPGDEAGIAERLVRAGIKATLLPTRVRREDGTLARRATDMVLFVWDDVSYLYHDNACYAASRYTPQIL